MTLKLEVGKYYKTRDGRKVGPMGNNKEHRPWKDLTDIEKGELLLAHHEGKVIEVYDNGMWVIPLNMIWYDWNSYRIKPEPVVDVKEFWIDKESDGSLSAYSTYNKLSTHKITFQLIDGKPDCNSIKMEEL